MDEFLIQNAERYQTLVRAFKPGASTLASNEKRSSTSPDIVVSTRIRPFLEEEASDRVFDSEANTEDVYEIASHLVPFARSGGIGTLFAYGQTGSGKTFTVSGLEKLLLQALMDANGLDGNRVFMTVVELAGNSAFDLLNSRKPIAILEDAFGVTQLAGALEQRAKSIDDALSLIESATTFRRTQSTQKNDVSSRSHAICRVRIERDTANTDADGLLYLVDLAGSEAARDVATHSADRMKEAREINASHSVLKDCIRSKVESDALDAVALTASKSEKMKMKKPHVPFRRSALTKILKHVFDPAGARNCKTVVVACVNPSIADVGASRNTLRYAEMLRVLTPKTKHTVYKSNVPMTWENEHVKQWIDKNSGTPPILSAVLAPVENGAQLLRLPDSDFETRCLITRGATLEQAKGLHSRLWELHIDSQRNSRQDDGLSVQPGIAEATAAAGELKVTQQLSSRELDPKVSMFPFKERIRPGMVVSWTPPHNFTMGRPGKMNLAMVLCPAEAAGHSAKDVLGSVADSARGSPDDSKKMEYLCALILPGTIGESYMVSIWQQVVIEIGALNAEVCLEYDLATRLYYIAL